MKKSSSSFSNTWPETSLFLKRWIDNPLQLGALLPSSRTLARKLAHFVSLENLEEDSFVLEIGAGTGRLTESLLEVVAPEKLICLEIDPKFCEMIEKRFPGVTVIQGNACNLKSILKPHLHGKISLTISGIPMMSLSFMIQKQIISSCFDVMQAQGKFFQLTYSPFSSIRAHLFHLRKRRLATVFYNFPPASVWCYEKYK